MPLSRRSTPQRRRAAFAAQRATSAYGPLSAAFHAAHTPRDAGSLLEAMVGTGRLLAPLVDAGFVVHGVDASQAMLTACAARLAATMNARANEGADPGDAYLFRQNSAALNLPFRYGAVVVAAGSFQLLADPAEAISALSRFRAHLVEPGLLLLDLVVPSAAEHPPGAAVVEVRHATLDDGSQIARRSETRCDIDGRRIIVASRYEQKRGTRVVAREDEAVQRTWYSENEIVAALAGAGYAAIRVEPSPLAHVGGHRFAVSAHAW